MTGTSWRARSRAKGLRCDSVQLDSGRQSLDAQSFYEREGMVETGFHYSIKVD